ncbi:hypothetical protein [Micromonospora avicenniae]|uniref:Uncharacterized protein n=1 Tax=Micromonospora avicenniae TaxID=1198245 RepID=A0A1N6U639_9ACTN|nr:hypothetical protein [Micromonospora avicenniae]SIQ60766.1 hypothetical protein SAMN05444858_103224 [Micromonospora avicenniae]
MFGIGKKRDREIRDAVEELARADTLAFGGVGFAGTLLPVTEAYGTVEAALTERPDVVRGHVDRLLAHGSPAGRAYAATLLERVDPLAARAAWAAMRDDPGEFNTFSGCLMGRSSLGEYAAIRLADA